MTQTTKYKLPQWEKPDRILMEDFNGMAAKLETALTAHDTAIAGLNSGKADKTTTTNLQTQVNQKADTTALTAAVASLQGQINQKTAVAVGAYVGDDKATRSFNLGFAPKAVYLCNQSGVAGRYTGGSYHIEGGLALPGYPLKTYHSDTAEPLLELTDTGFTVHNKPSSYLMNSSTYIYYYIALC